MRTVLFFAHECAPFHRPESTVGAQRPAQFAKYLPEFGWRAIVVCCDASRRGQADGREQEAVASDTRRALRAADPESSLVVPTPSLKWDGALDKWWRAALSANGNAGAVRKLVRKGLTLAKFTTGDYSQSWQPCARWAATAIAGETDVDACVAEHSPDAGLFLSAWFAREYGVPWLADFRDPILQPLEPLARRLYRPISRRLVSTASGTIGVTPAWTALDAEHFGKQAWTITNGFDPREFDVPESHEEGMFTVAYLGRVDQLQRMDMFVDGLARVHERVGAERFRRVRFVYRGHGAEKVRELAARAGVVERCDIGAHVERDLALSIMRGAELLLLLSISDPDPFFSTGFYPAKTFEYFGAARPIMCVPGDGGILDSLLRDTGTGATCATAEDVTDALVRALSSWEQGAGIPYSPDLNAVAQFSRQNLAGDLARILDATV